MRQRRGNPLQAEKRKEARGRGKVGKRGERAGEGEPSRLG